MIENISKFGGSPNNSKYIPQKTIYRTAFNQMYPNDSYNEIKMPKDIEEFEELKKEIKENLDILQEREKC